MATTTPRERFAIRLASHARSIREIREAIRHLDRIARKHNRNERDARIYEQMIARMKSHDLPLAEEWKHLCW